MTPAHNGTATSMAAAVSIVPHRKALAMRVLMYISQAGIDGLTCDELEVLSGLSHQTASARVNELANPMVRAIVPAGHRPTRSGRNAVVWITP